MSLTNFLEKVNLKSAENTYFIWKYLIYDDFEKWVAYLLIRGSDQAKYGTFKKGPQYQFIWTMINIQKPIWQQ